MKPFLMYADRDFDVNDTEGFLPRADDLTNDLDLKSLWRAAAQDDDNIFGSVRSAMLSSLVSPDEIDFRLDVLDDCTQNPGVVRDLYQLVHELIDKDQRIFRASYFRLSNETMLNRATEGLAVFLSSLRNVRQIADRSAAGFTSKGFTTLFNTIQRELNDEFFDGVESHLRTLRFRDGPLASAHLGHLNQGVDYTLRAPQRQNQSRFLRRPPVSTHHFSRTIAHDDHAGQQGLDDLRNRILGLAAVAVAQSVQDIREFYVALHSELGFYVGCLNLGAQVTASGQSLCRPVPHAVDSERLTATGLYNPCLTVRGSNPNCTNDLRGDHRSLVFITGANQGGKSTFLRGIGIAHLMMQCGMFVCAQSFTASAVDGVLSHFTREEDPSMTRGKFDEEMERMSCIAKELRPGSLLLCNETFASTNEREGAQIATEVIRALTHCGITVVFVTHLYELAHHFYEQGERSVLFLRAERAADGRRNFQLHEGEPLATSFAEDLFHATFEHAAGSRPPAAHRDRRASAVLESAP